MPSRWWIAGLLFASTTINYLDRQTLSVLAPRLKTEFTWTNSDFALIVMAFRAAYAVGQLLSGRLLDRVGTRTGLAAAVTAYSGIAMLTSLATGLHSFAACRFLLGLGESANWPGAAKAVAEWFPKQQRGWAVALYDSGSAIGGALAPALVLGLAAWFGSWRPAFVIVGALGFAWVACWLRVYPRTPPAAESGAGVAPRAWMELARSREAWGIILGRTLSDPVWFFVSDWFAVFLVARGFQLENTVAGFWAPFLAADLGNFAGGGFSSWLIGSRGWPVERARKFVVILGGLGMTSIAGAVWTTSFFSLVALFALATFSYAALSTMILTLPADLFEPRAVASVSGMSGAGAGVGTILTTFIIGAVADRYSFEPVLIAASLIPLAAVAAVLWLIKPTRADRSTR
jgi:ACS family hexuronate transporter-like MFS transporter